MSTIPVELPDELRKFIETKISGGQFANASEYIAALVDAARKKRSDIEAALLDGLNSGPAEEWTDQNWNEIKQRVIARHRKS